MTDPDFGARPSENHRTAVGHGCMQTAPPRVLADAPPTGTSSPTARTRRTGLSKPGRSSWCGCCLSAHDSRHGSHGAATPSTVGVRAWLAELRTGHLALSTPCSEWTVRQLLTHVIGGDYAYIDLPHVTQRSTSQGQDVRTRLCHSARLPESGLSMIIVSDPSADATRPFAQADTWRHVAAVQRHAVTLPGTQAHDQSALTLKTRRGVLRQTNRCQRPPGPTRSPTSTTTSAPPVADLTHHGRSAHRRRPGR